MLTNPVEPLHPHPWRTAEHFDKYWHVLWFTVNGGSFHVLYLLVLVLIAFLWRPAANNTRYIDGARNSNARC